MPNRSNNRGNNPVLPGYKSLSCVACGDTLMFARLSKSGGPYYSCLGCGMKIFGLNSRAIARIKFFSTLLASEKIKDQWESSTSIGQDAQEAIVTANAEVYHGN